jgi:hypothetical protein
MSTDRGEDGPSDSAFGSHHLQNPCKVLLLFRPTAAPLPSRKANIGIHTRRKANEGPGKSLAGSEFDNSQAITPTNAGVAIPSTTATASAVVIDWDVNKSPTTNVAVAETASKARESHPFMAVTPYEAIVSASSAAQDESRTTAQRGKAARSPVLVCGAAATGDGMNPPRAGNQPT